MQNVLVATGSFCHKMHLRMGKGALFVLFIVFSTTLFLLAPSANAAQTTPYKMPFQGRLTDSMGSVVPDGLYNIKFRLMSASTGGSNLWQADRVYTGSGTSDHRVQVTNGRFSVQLGDTATGVGDPVLSPSIFNTQTNATVYLEIELPTPATARCSSVSCGVFTELPMTPRQLVSAAPYAMNADTIDGIDGASIAQLSANQTFTGNNTFTGTFTQQKTSSTAFRVQNAGGTNALLVDTSSLAVKVGGGDISPDASPTLLVVDYKNTSGDPTGIDGSMYYNSATGSFRCQEDGLWKNCISSARTRFEMHYEFLRSSTPALGDATYVLDGGLYTKLTSGNFNRLIGELNHPGIIQFRTGTSATGLAALASSSDTTHGILFGGGAWTNTAVLRVPTASVTGQTFNIYSGFLDLTTTLNPSNGCFFRYTDTLNNGRWQGVCRNGGSETGCDPVKPVNTSASAVGGSTWYTLKVAVNAAATQATFVVEDGTDVFTCSVTNNIPTSSRVSVGMGIRKTTGTTQVAADFDLTETVGEGLSR